jgi:hypothetical protein
MKKFNARHKMVFGLDLAWSMEKRFSVRLAFATV